MDRSNPASKREELELSRFPTEVVVAEPISPLRCPSCNAAITAESGKPLSFDDDEYCVAVCGCSRYPVIAGIPVVHEAIARFADARLSTGALLYLIEQGDFEEAFFAAVEPASLYREQPPSTLRKLVPAFLDRRQSNKEQAEKVATWRSKFRALAKSHEAGSTRALIRHYFNATPGGAEHSNYFGYKLATPKYFAMHSLISSAHRGGPALDVGCGIAWASRALAQTSTETFGIDQNFFLLWLSKTRISPTTKFVCCEAGSAIPLADKAMDTVVVANTVQFIFWKRNFFAELDRVSSDRAAWLLTSVRHRLSPAATPNTALSPHEYGNLLGRPYTMVPEHEIVSGYLAGDSADLRKSRFTPHDMNTEELIDIVASHDPDVFTPSRALTTIPHALGTPAINPLYQAHAEAGAVRFQLNWPSSQYKDDNLPMPSYLPESVTLTPEILAELGAGRVSDAATEMAIRGAVIDLPEGY